MIYLSAQPAIPYYTWQVEVMVSNFLEQGIAPSSIHVVCSYNGGGVPEQWVKLRRKFEDVGFYFYKDTRLKPSYISSVRPHILEKHWIANPSLANETVLYHDCDIIFPSKPNFSHLLNDGICYVSNTVSYIGARYINSKGEDYLDLMTDIVGIDKNQVIAEEENSGGAQYLIKNVGAEYWSKVYHDSETLYRVISRKIGKDKPEHPLQIWTADMWAVLWNLWLQGKQVKVTQDLSFCWGTSPITEWDKHPIYHNAGVTNGTEMFHKAAYQSTLPYKLDLSKISDKWANHNYAKFILKVGESSCLL